MQKCPALKYKYFIHINLHYHYSVIKVLSIFLWLDNVLQINWVFHHKSLYILQPVGTSDQTISAVWCKIVWKWHVENTLHIEDHPSPWLFALFNNTRMVIVMHDFFTKKKLVFFFIFQCNQLTDSLPIFL